MALLLLVIIALGGMAYIRLAPSDPARWHRMVSPADGPGGVEPALAGTDPVTEVSGGAYAMLTLPDARPADVLARLDAIALATPRTRRLAGGPEEGGITWITRSALFGFPDYTTAVARADGPVTALALHARQRFGRRDFGVNAARLKVWITRLTID